MIISKQNEIEQLNEKIRTTVNSLRRISQSTDLNNRYRNIRSLFSDFFGEVVNEIAVLSWKINKNGNVEFIPPKVKSKHDKNADTAKDEGNTYMKLLCVCFDLAIICAYRRESYFRFIYHDDVLSQQDNGIKLRLLRLIDKLCNKYDFQYIISTIKSDLPLGRGEKVAYFNESEIVLKLHDKDLSGTLFGVDF